MLQAIQNIWDAEFYNYVNTSCKWKEHSYDYSKNDFDEQRVISLKGDDILI